LSGMWIWLTFSGFILNPGSIHWNPKHTCSQSLVPFLFHIKRSCFTANWLLTLLYKYRPRFLSYDTFGVNLRICAYLKSVSAKWGSFFKMTTRRSRELSAWRNEKSCLCDAVVMTVIVAKHSERGSTHILSIISCCFITKLWNNEC
jgi:hypothetical protein